MVWMMVRINNDTHILTCKKEKAGMTCNINKDYLKLYIFIGIELSV